MDLGNSNRDELIKIKEDAIEIQKHDLDDVIKSIENENTKSSLILGFSGVLLGIVFRDLDSIPKWRAIIFLFLLMLSIGFSLYNMAAKKVKIHTNVDDIFVNNTPDEWEKYLNFKHLRLRESYEEAKRLLYQKAYLTIISFILLILSSLILVVIKIWG